MCRYLAGIDPNTLIPRKVVPSRDIYPYNEYETRKQERGEKRRRAVNEMRLQMLLEKRAELSDADVARYRWELTGAADIVDNASRDDDVSEAVDELAEAKAEAKLAANEASRAEAEVRALTKEAKIEAKEHAAAEKAREEAMAAMAEAERIAEEGIAELAHIVAATVNDKDGGRGVHVSLVYSLDLRCLSTCHSCIRST